jgi:hypothetical protein
MQPTERLNELREFGRMRWMDSASAWIAEPDEVMNALASDGFEECKREETRNLHRESTGGVWQGLNNRTGAVASAVWVRTESRQPMVFIDIDGEPLREG